jgi:predicted MPP superfamily phosphohydrolase
MEGVCKLIHENLNKFKEDNYERELRFHLHNMKGVKYETLDNIITSLKRSKKWTDKGKVQDVVENGKSKSKLPDTRHVKTSKGSEFIMKKRIFIQDYEEFSLRFAVSSETDLEINQNDFYDAFTVTNIRERNRHSFESVDKHWKVDLTRVKTNNDISFECEIECLSKEIDYSSVCRLVKTFYKLVHGHASITKTQINAILDDYQQMTKIRMPKFAGPLPFTLMKENLEKNSFACGYSVTDKADGERKLCYIDSIGNVVLISRSNGSTVQYLGKQNKIKSSLLDCELVKSSLYVFDCMFHNGKDVRKQNHLERLQLGSQCIKIKKDLKMKIKTKTFFFVHKGIVYKMFDGNYIKTKFKTIFEAAHDIWISKHEYSLDGIIFTPIYEEYFNNKIYKWKDNNTIDFFINKLDVKGTTEKWGLKIAGFDYKKSYKHFPLGGIDKAGKFLHFTDRAVPVQSLIPINKGVITLPSSVANKYDNHSVAEFKFVKGNFYPMNARKDKSFANNIRAVNDAWKSITDPISITDIRDYYYNCARRFHNHIKDVLIKKYASKKNILNIGIGAGGNIKKYEYSKVKSLVGVNVVETKYKSRIAQSKFFKSNKNVYNIHNFTKNSFDTVNLMFSVHYFFKNRTTFVNFINNLYKSVRRNGNVVMTMMNGQKILKLVKNGSFENSVCKIVVKQNDPKKLLGNSMEVKLYGSKYFENSVSNEYLVNISQFIKFMENIGFKLIENKSFKTLCGEYCKMMTHDEKQFSFLNNYLVFKRVSQKLDVNNVNIQFLT